MTKAQKAFRTAKRNYLAATGERFDRKLIEFLQMTADCAADLHRTVHEDFLKMQETHSQNVASHLKKKMEASQKMLQDKKQSRKNK